jgi:6-phosphofructo-2-kinase/fructose-2,6-biphosphatase 2
MESRIVYFLMNLNTSSKHFFMSRHGESMYNLEGKIGGNSDLSPRGEAFAKMLPEIILEQIGQKKLIVWTSTLKRYACV